MCLRAKDFLKVDVRRFSIWNQSIIPGRWRDLQDLAEIETYNFFLHSTIINFMMPSVVDV